MSSISSDKKMQLAKMIRDEHQNNRIKMNGREEFLYGKRSYINTPDIVAGVENTPSNVATHYSFSLRFFIAAFLLVGFIVWNNNQTEIMGKGPNEIYTLLRDESTMTNIIDFIENITYTQRSVTSNAEIQTD